MTNIITAVVTAYCSCKLCCGPNATGITANGHKPTPNHTIAGSRNLPFNTIVQIAGKTYYVEDRLAKRFDNRFDIYMGTHQEAKKHGIKTQQVTIITADK